MRVAAPPGGRAGPRPPAGPCHAPTPTGPGRRSHFPSACPPRGPPPAPGKPSQACDQHGLPVGWLDDGLWEKLSKLGRSSRHYFLDGSRYPHPIREWDRAAWAIVICIASGEHIRTVSAPIYPPLPQSSQAGEHAAFVAASSLPQGKAYTDCASVEASWNFGGLSNSPCLGHHRAYSGLLMMAKGNGCRHDLVKVRSHLNTRATGITEQDRFERVGNDEADTAAKHAVSQHVAPSTSLKSKVGTLVRLARAALTLAGELLPRWDKLDLAGVEFIGAPSESSPNPERY